MLADASVFLEFNLPNATTWFYFSFLLAVALFFKFSRLLSIRNWDVVTLFLLAPGLLILQANRPEAKAVHPRVLNQVAAGVALGTEPLASLAVLGKDLPERVNWTWMGYLWLLCGSGYFFLRCLFDLVLVQRPALGPNLNFGGLAWLAGALFICLMAVAFRQGDRNRPHLPSEGVQVVQKPVGKETAWFALTREWFHSPGTACLCHLLVVLGLVTVSYRHFNDVHAGMAAATFYLMLPYTGLYVSQVHHVWPMALVLWALAIYPYPFLSGLLLGLGAGTAYFPGLLFPVWLSFYWKRGAGRFFLGFAFAGLSCLAGVGWVLWMEGELASSLREVWDQLPWKVPSPTTESFWTGIRWAYRIPIFVGYFVFLVITLFWPYPKNLAHVLALSSATLIGIQFWFADQGGVYVLWYLPLLLLMVFRPNLADRRPEEPQPRGDFLMALLRRLWGSKQPV